MSGYLGRVVRVRMHGADAAHLFHSKIVLTIISRILGLVFGFCWFGVVGFWFFAGMLTFLALAHMFNAAQLLRFLLGC